MFWIVKPKLLLYGLALWIVGTIALRLAGQHILRPDRDWTATLRLFAVTFPLMAITGRRVCSGLLPRREDWPAGALSLVLPTLALDPFSSAFFPSVFPNIAPEMAGVFGGWMLWCCAGAIAGVMFRRPEHG